MIPIINPLSDWDNLPLSHARIGYENVLTATTSGSTALTMLTKNTYERFQPLTGTFTIKFQPDSDTEIDFIGLAAHNLATHDGGISVLFQYATTVGGALTDIEEVTPTDNSAIMLLFDPITVAEVAITFTTVSNGIELGVIYAGKALQMYQPIYGGHDPINLNASTEYQSVMSESGQFIGRTITSEGIETNFNWRHLDPDWYRERFQPFVLSARRNPFFIKWRPDLYNETAFGWTENDIRPQNMGGGHLLMNVSFSMRGHSDIRS